MTCDRQEKVLSSPKVLLRNFLQIRNSFWRYAEINRLWVGSSEIPILWELQQDDRTVCCSHTIVYWYQRTIQWVKFYGIGEFFSDFVRFFFAWRAWRAGPQSKIWIRFFCFKYIYFIETSWWLVINRKKFCLVPRYYWETFYKKEINFEGTLN